MNKIRQSFSAALLLALVAMCATAAQAQRPYRMNDRQVEAALRRVETDADRFRSSFASALDRSRFNGTSTEDQLNGYVQGFETATDQLRSRFNNRTAAGADVENVLTQAAYLNDFMMRNRLGARAMNDWTSLRADLDALARVYNVTWDWTRTGVSYNNGNTRNNGNTGYGNQTGVAYRINDRQLDALIRRIENGTDRFRADLGTALDRSTYNGSRAEDNINQFVRDFETATDQLRSRFGSRNSATSDVESVLRQATYIDDFMRRNSLSARAENDWMTLRGDLNQLATAYSVAWNWDVNALPGYGDTAGNGSGRGGVFGGNGRAANRLTGTFRLDPAQSDNPNTVADNAIRSLPYAERQSVRDQIMRRLNAPEMLAIERSGNNVTIASSRAPQTTFVANAGENREQLPNGSYSRVTSTIVGDRLVVSSAGNRETDFTVTFDPIEGGRRLRVTRQIWNDRLGANPLTVANVYDRTSDVAEWNVYNGTTGSGQQTGSYGNAPNGSFIVPDGQTLTARLETDLTTRTANVGDRFTMTVTSPGQYEGSVIEGRVANVNRSGRVTGRADMSLNFDTIRTRDGRTYQFAGFVESVRATNGQTVQVDNEGTVRDDDSRGSTTAQRAAIGSAVGAIIGAIAGGGKGAVIGAVLGGGAGAGSVYVQGKEDLDLLSGSELTIRASAPNR
jgi:outer membrane lipoprotein SlyB